MGTTVWHGAYDWRSRFDIVQHRYACTDCADESQGYAELLEIRDAPEAHSRWILHSFFDHDGSTFHEFATVEAAMDAWPEFLKVAARWQRGVVHELVFTGNSVLTKGHVNPLRRQAGFIRTVYCGLQKPWFYAAEGEEVSADFVAH